MNSSRQNSGLTLIEVVIAVSIGALIVLASYNILDNIINIEKVTQKKATVQKHISCIFTILLKDIESATSHGRDITVNKSTLSLPTENCYYIPGICRVTYYTVKWKDKTCLVRRESRINAIKRNTGIEIPISCEISGFDIFTPTSDGWEKARAGVLKTNLLKLNINFGIESENYTVPFIFKIRTN